MQARPVEVEDAFECFQGPVDVGFQLACTHTGETGMWTFSSPAHPKPPLPSAHGLRYLGELIKGSS